MVKMFHSFSWFYFLFLMLSCLFIILFSCKNNIIYQSWICSHSLLFHLNKYFIMHENGHIHVAYIFIIMQINFLQSDWLRGGIYREQVLYIPWANYPLKCPGIPNERPFPVWTIMDILKYLHQSFYVFYNFNKEFLLKGLLLISIC